MKFRKRISDAIEFIRTKKINQPVPSDPVEHDPMKPEADGLFPAEYLATIRPDRLSKEAQVKVFNHYMKPYASALCNKCYGRGYMSFNILEKKLEVCSCVENNIAQELTKLIPEEDQKANLILPKGLE